MKTDHPRSVIGATFLLLTMVGLPKYGVIDVLSNAKVLFIQPTHPSHIIEIMNHELCIVTIIIRTLPGMKTKHFFNGRFVSYGWFLVAQWFGYLPRDWWVEGSKPVCCFTPVLHDLVIKGYLPSYMQCVTLSLGVVNILDPFQSIEKRLHVPYTSFFYITLNIYHSINHKESC